VSVNLRQLAADAAAIAAKATAAKAAAMSPISDAGSASLRRSSNAMRTASSSAAATASRTFMRTFALVDGDGREVVIPHTHPMVLSLNISWPNFNDSN
jgi:hypothetical protein